MDVLRPAKRILVVWCQQVWCSMPGMDSPSTALSAFSGGLQSEPNDSHSAVGDVQEIILFGISSFSNERLIHICVGFSSLPLLFLGAIWHSPPSPSPASHLSNRYGSTFKS